MYVSVDVQSIITVATVWTVVLVITMLNMEVQWKTRLRDHINKSSFIVQLITLPLSMLIPIYDLIATLFRTEK